MKLLWYETEQLVDHIASREDIWTSSRAGLWLRNRTYDDNTSMMGLAITGPIPATGPFRQFSLRTVPMHWTAEQCDEYLANIATKWTDYGTRRRYASFLVAEAGIPAERANAIATALCTLDQGYSLTNAAEPEPDNNPVIPTPGEACRADSDDQRFVRSFAITGGGWVTIRLAGGVLRVKASLRSSGEYGGGFGGVFNGFLRPSGNESTELAAAFLFGLPTSQRTFFDEAEQYDLQEQPRDVEGGTSEQRADLPQPEPGTAV